MANSTIPKRKDVWKKTPRFLYRTYCSSSAGINTIHEISSNAVKFGNHETLLFQDPGPTNGLSPEKQNEMNEKARKSESMLTQHLQWRYNDNDDLVSWTSSLLFALQRAIFARGRNDRNISICMVDTWKMSETTFYHAKTLLESYSVPSLGYLRHGFFTVEYLAVGTVKVNACNSDTVRFDSLVANGLLKLIPHLNNQGPGLWIPFNNIRERNFNFAFPTSRQDVDIAWVLASNFSQARSLAFFINVLAMQKRELDDEIFLEALNEKYFDMSLEEGFFSFRDVALESALDKEMIEFSHLSCAAREKWNQRGMKRKAALDQAAKDLVGLMSKTSIKRKTSWTSDVDFGSGSWTSDDGSFGHDDFYSGSEDDAEENNMNDNLMKMIEGDWY